MKQKLMEDSKTSGPEASKDKSDRRLAEEDREAVYLKRLKDVGESCQYHFLLYN